MRVTGTRNINNVTAIDVEKPTSTDGEFLFNSQFPIAVPSSTETGVGWAFRFGVVIMTGADPSEPGIEYLPIAGSWEVEEGSGPFVVYGHHRANEESDDRALIGRFAGGGSGGRVTSVRFKIVSSDPTTLSGLATILAWDYGFSKTAIPASILGNTVIEICDPMGCFLNEPNVDLTDRAGVAVYRESDVPDNCRTGYVPFPGVWEVTSLCCKLLSCDVVI
jgi:hypothetical protein